MDFADANQLLELRAGNLTAFEMYFRTYYRPLSQYAYTFLNDKDEAEEVVQNTFLSLWEKRETIEIRTSLKSYLYTMVRNACLNLIKHEKIKLRHAQEQVAIGEYASHAVTDNVLGNELEVRIQAAIQKLPEQCRLIFKLSRFEELKYAEIAEQLNLSVKTVENQMGKALRIMREELKDYMPVIIVLMNGFLS